MLTLALYRYLSKPGHGVECVLFLSIVIGSFLSLPIIFIAILPLVGLDFCLLALAGLVKVIQRCARNRREAKIRQKYENSLRESAEREARSRELARIEANKRELLEKTSAAASAVEPAVADIRSFWAERYDLIGERYSLSQVNSLIDNARRAKTPFDQLAELAAIKDTLVRDSMILQTIRLYGQLYPIISKIVPQEEFHRLLEEAGRNAPSTQDYGRRMLQIGEMLGSVAGPAQQKFAEARQQEQIAAYDRMFADDNSIDEQQSPDRLSPFEESAEERSASRVG